MMTNEYTPGPWVDVSWDSLPPVPEYMQEYFHEGYKPGTSDDHVCFISINEMKAYAALAVKEAINNTKPELLEALIELEKISEGSSRGEVAARLRARKAIAKATGANDD